jgi:protein CpxP
VKSVRSMLVVAAAGLALAVGLAFAQTEGGAPMHHGMGMHAHRMGGGEFGMFLHQLNLSDDQKAQVKQIFQNEKQNMRPLVEQEAQAHLQMIKLITGGNFTPSAAAQVASQEAQTHIQLEVEHAKIGSQIYSLLNSDQKAKVADMISKHEQMIEQRSNKPQSTPSEQQ